MVSLNGLWWKMLLNRYSTYVGHNLLIWLKKYVSEADNFQAVYNHNRSPGKCPLYVAVQLLSLFSFPHM